MKRNKSDLLDLTQPEQCCDATTGCDFDGSLRNVVTEPIYVQKVYDAALFNLQGLRTIAGQGFRPRLPVGSRILRVIDIRCKKFFNPADIKDPKNLTVTPETEISGADFVKCGDKDVKVIGPDGTRSERLVFVDTTDCDEEDRGTPIFGTQNIKITGNVIVEIDILYTDDCGERCRATLTANVPVAPINDPLILTNFFQLCLPSVFEGAFLPRFTEFCNIACETRLATQNITRDLMVNPETGAVRGNLLVSLCVTCEKKIVVPVQLCVLSTGFPQLAAEIAPICETFPSLFPRQIDESNEKHGCALGQEDLDPID
ncbi:hypothetical protein GOQ27_16880 [Clostridium sp. D2Q-11]|uniref:Uncharacterized protein n=1 Tax=Anaeromonas frigoriresistens TaxID=2683708 RepID=A0A942Z825_9FIRM|nr:hypothetical protein [Anaeromonas frigoriresistens]MBS4540156.1 hypothetical protein [Anaeromonas frigoriresistens]